MRFWSYAAAVLLVGAGLGLLTEPGFGCIFAGLGLLPLAGGWGKG